MNRGEVSADGWTLPLAALLIDEACRRLPEPERTERALRFAAGQYRTAGRATPRPAVGRADRPERDESGLAVVALLGSALAAAVFGGGIGYVTRNHDLAVDAAVLVGTTLLSLAVLAATAVVVATHRTRSAGRRPD